MFLSVSQDVLSEHLQTVCKAVPLKTTITALEGILLESDGKKVTLTANNLEMGIRSSFSVSQTKVGKVLLPAKIVEIIKRLPDKSVEFSVNADNYLTNIKSGQSEFQLYGTNPEEFPSFPVSVEDKLLSFSINCADLRRILRQTLFAISHDEGKTAFTGIQFSVYDDVLTLASSDTFRLANTKCKVINKEGENADFLVPAKIMQEVVRIFSDDESFIKVDFLKNQLLLESGDTKLVSRLLDEKFPNVDRVIPKEYSTQAIVDVNSLQRAVERASLLAEGVNHIIRMSINSSEIVIKAASKYGKVQEQIPVKLDGDELEIALNARFLLDMLKICEGENCAMQFTGSYKPIVLKDFTYKEYLYLVLPVKS